MSRGAEAAGPAASMVGWLEDELTHAVDDQERGQYRIDRLQARITAAEATQDPDVEIRTGNDRRDDDEDDERNR